MSLGPMRTTRSGLRAGRWIRPTPVCGPQLRPASRSTRVRQHSEAPLPARSSSSKEIGFLKAFANRTSGSGFSLGRRQLTASAAGKNVSEERSALLAPCQRFYRGLDAAAPVGGAFFTSRRLMSATKRQSEYFVRPSNASHVRRHQASFRGVSSERLATPPMHPSALRIRRHSALRETAHGYR